MNEKSYMIGIDGRFKVIFSKYQKRTFIKQIGNLKWASLVETIGTSSW